jgi:glycosidase
LKRPRDVRTVVLAVASVALLAGCPAAQDGPGDDDVGDDDAPPTDAGVPDAYPTCENPMPTCTLTIGYDGAGTDVELHGDFADDGWTAGVSMARNGDRWEVTLDVADEQVIVYKFVVDGAWIPDPANPRTSPDGYGGQNSVVRAECDQCPEPPAIDWRDSILYFVMIDRFANGEAGNDDPLGLEDAADYQGGDMVGLIERIESGYFADLGVNTLWITSPFDNADGSGIGTDAHLYSGYHGYWPKDLDAVEARAGTEADLERLVEVAHQHGLKIIVDYVMNHVHSESPVYVEHQDWFWPNTNGSGGNCVCGGGCSWDDSTQRKRCWFTDYLPDFDFNNGDARRWSVQNAIAWAKRVGLDGFRLDAVKHIEDSWLLDLRGRLSGEVEEEQRFYLVGETYTGDRDLIKYYVQPDTMLDGQFDFPLRANVLATILRRSGSMNDLVAFLDSNAAFYGAGSVMSTFIGNHDVPRVIHIAEDTPQFGDWDGGRDRAWTNRPSLPGSPNPFERVAVAYTLLMTTPGIPLIYYGDEIGMPGAGDPDNRRFMQWDGYSDDQVWLRDRIAGLAKARAAHASLRRGTRQSLGSSNDVYTYAMTGEGDQVYVVLNRGDDAEPATGLPAGSYRDLVTGETVSAPMQVPPRTGLVLAPQ